MIKDLPTRYPELGRLRLGDKDDAGKMTKLDTWRVTTPDDFIAHAIASMFGGDVGPWQPPDGPEQLEVVTEVSSIEVLIPPDAVDTAYEAWGRGGRQRRCDGIDCTRLDTSGKEPQMVDEACWCKAHDLTPGNNDDVKKGACDMVLRLKVVIPGAPGVGVFVMTTGSFYAITQIPAQVALLESLRAQGALVPAELAIVPHREKKAWEKFAREFYVPDLRIRRSLHQLAELSSGGAAASLGAGTVAAIERASSRPSTIADKPPHVQQVVYACGEHGIDRATSKQLVARFTGGRTETRNDLTVLEAGAMVAALVDGTWRSLISPSAAEREAEPEQEAPPPVPAASTRPDSELQGALTTIVNLPADLKEEAQRLSDEAGIPDHVDQLTAEHRQKIIDIAATLAAEAQARRELGGEVDLVAEAQAAGVRTASLLKQARAFAADLGLDQPKAVEEITDDTLVSRVRGWLQEKGTAA